VEEIKEYAVFTKWKTILSVTENKHLSIACNNKDKPHMLDC
jgi:hypothetical protein